MGVGDGTAARAGGGAAAGLGATTVGAGLGGAATGVGAFTGAGLAAGLATGVTAAGLAFAAGGGPNVMRARNGSAEIRGNETGRLSAAIAGEIRAGFDSRDAIAGRSKGRKSAASGSGASATAAVVDSISPSRSSSPNPVVRKREEAQSFQRIAGEKSMAPCFNSALVPFWFPTTPCKYSVMGRP